MTIALKDIQKNFGRTQILKDIDLAANSGELLALLGPSGSGKTTVLRMIAGLEHSQTGTIYIGNRDVTQMSPRDRKVGFVFQHYALFSHMTVAKNIAYGLNVLKKSSRPSKQKIHEKVDELLSLVKLEGLGERFPSQLSGGQRQRVALARALAIEPQVLLLDEPFGALDAQVRKELRRWLRSLQEQTGITTVLVTHDQEEAMDVADQIIVLNEGNIAQTGSPGEIYETPNSPFVYQFLGNANEFRGKAYGSKVKVDGATWSIPQTFSNAGKDVISYARPHEFYLDKKKTKEDQLEVVITSTHSIGPIVFIEGFQVENEAPINLEQEKQSFEQQGFQTGDRAFIKPSNLGVFQADHFHI